MKTVVTTIILLTAALFGFAACQGDFIDPGMMEYISGGGLFGDGDGGFGGVAVTDVTLDKTELTLAVGRTETLTATVAPEDATNKTISWESSNNGVATVANGLVTAVAEGTAVITAAAYGGETATCAVTVDNRPLGVWRSTTGGYQPYTLTITAGTIRWEDRDGDFIQYANVQWTAAANNNTANKTNYPNGYTFTGTRTSRTYSGSLGFVALSTDGQSVYLGTNASTASSSNNSGSIYTKVSHPAITTTSLPSGRVGTTYSQTLAATGDTPITWTTESGVLPAGLTLAGTTGAITGTPTTAGTSTFTVKATNTAGSSTKTLSIVISPQ